MNVSCCGDVVVDANGDGLGQWWQLFDNKIILYGYIVSNLPQGGVSGSHHEITPVMTGILCLSMESFLVFTMGT